MNIFSEPVLANRACPSLERRAKIANSLSTTYFTQGLGWGESHEKNVCVATSKREDLAKTQRKNWIHGQGAPGLPGWGQALATA